jgi:hypothetical protein
MLNKLSAAYQKEIALGLLSLFFISGLASAKASASMAYRTAAVHTAGMGGKAHKPLPVLPRPLADGKAATAATEGKGFAPVAPAKPNMVRLSADKKMPIGGPAQPEMSSFKSVGADNMVDPFTGDFSYNLPLMDVGGYPVTMFYNSGITMDQEASWVGLGWNINPGTIMRNMRGLPDDFNGTDIITKRQSTRPDKTWGVSAGAGLKFAGFPIKALGIGIEANAGVSFNNKLGVALEAGIHPSLSISAKAGDDKTASLSFGANLSTSSRSGASVTPSVNMSLTKNDAASGTSSTASLGASYSYSSRQGVTGMHLNAGLSKSKAIGTTDNSKFYKLTSVSGSVATLGSSISFAYPTVVPSVKSIFTRRSYNLSFSVGGEFYGLNGHGRLAGFYTENRIDAGDRETKHPAYGILHYQKANNDVNAMLDFNRVNDGVYTPTTPAMAMPVYTYDVFSINAEGTGGSFRAYRGDLGAMRDPQVKTRDDAGSLGLDLGFGNTVHGGVEFSYAYTPSEVGGWKVNNLANSVFKFKDNNADYQSVYFKNPGEKTIPDAAYQDAIGGENLVRLKLANIASGTPMLLPSLVKYDASKNKLGEQQLTDASVTRTARDKRTQVISFLSAEEAARIGFDKKIYAYATDSAKILFGACDKTGIEQIDRTPAVNPLPTDYRKKHHISEINVLGTDGRKYVYGLPVYNIKQVDVSFSIGNGSNATGRSNYAAGTDDTENNKNGRDWFMEQTETPAYTHSFLLTSLVSPNYVDVKGDGITEDDMGDAVKFNYSKFNDYQWRTPTSNGQASYSEGLKTDNKDDKAHYVYGVREMWHLYSIESKNMLARFYVKNDRKDCRQVNGPAGGLDNNWGMQRLDKVCLYSKGDLMKHGNKAKPIKTVKFFQSYKLCKNVDGTGNSMVGFGKLTLDSVWITYNGNNKKAKTRYVFYYPNDKNPNYSYTANDRWGNYKPTTDDTGLPNNPGSLNNADYPYSLQDKAKADKYAAAWVMNKVLLPSGGSINIDYESDDYAYVQDKRASHMYQISGFGNTASPSGAQLTNRNIHNNGGAEFEYVYIKLPYAITAASVGDQKRELAARYLENTTQLYMKLAVVMPPSPGLPGVEMVPVHAEIDNTGGNGYGIVAGTGGTVAWVKVQRVAGGSTPMVQQALQFLRQQLPGKAYPGYDVSENSTAKAVVLALAGMLTSLASLKMGDDNMLKLIGRGREVDVDKSFARLSNPYLSQYGGGLRVKRVVLNDSWDKIGKQYAATYGQEYVYTTKEVVNGKETVISSGVAAWEPAIGSDANPHKEVMRFLNHNKGGPFDFGAVELPLGESFYPSPMVGYSRVEVLSIHRDTVKNQPARQVMEFYTTRDFPFKSSCTQLNDAEANVKYEPRAILQLLKLDMKKAITQSQGFLVEMNDMNGKVKEQATYTATDPVNPVSRTLNYYNVEKLSNKLYKFNHVFPTINKADGLVKNNSIIGREIELMADFREHKTETITTNIHINLDFFFLGIFPVPLTNLLQPTIYEGTTYRAASLLKIVNHYGMLDSVVVIDKGSMVSTKNLVYDAETGNPILTRTSNEYNKPVYNFSYPAHWAYSGMGPAYKNIDVTLSNLTFRHGKLETPVDMNLFESGDEMYVFSESSKGPSKLFPCDGTPSLFNNTLPKNNAVKIWAVHTGKVGSQTPQMVFMDAEGNPYTAEKVKLRIIRSGRRNQLDQMVGAIVSNNSPISASGALVFNTATQVLQTSAATFKDHWKVDNNLYAIDSVITTVTKTKVFPQSFWDPNPESMTITNDAGVYNLSPNQYVTISDLKKSNGTNRVRKAFIKYNLLDNFLNQHLDPSCIIENGQPIANAYTTMLNLYAHGCYRPNFSPDPHAGVHTAAGAWIGYYTSLTPLGNKSVIRPMTTPWNSYTNTTGWINSFNATATAPLQSFSDVDLAYAPASGVFTWNGDVYRVLPMIKRMMQERNSGINNTPGFSLEIFRPTPSVYDGGRENMKCTYRTKVPGCVDGGQGLWFQYYPCPGGKIESLVNPADPSAGAWCSTVTSITPVNSCLSKFTQRKSVNPYVEGIFGNWRVDSAYVYYGDRKETNPALPLDLRTAGAINNFKTFWNFNSAANGLLTRNGTASDVWVWNSVVTQYNRKGYDVESKDALGHFNAGLYGYNQQLPIAVANNARLREIAFDGFEDYDYQTALNCVSCKPRRSINFGNIAANIDSLQQHTGRYSLRVNGGTAIRLKAPVTSEAVADMDYRFRIKMDSTSYTTTVVTPMGTGFKGKYFNFSSGSSCGSAANAAANILNGTPNAIRQNEQINYPNFVLPPGINYTRFAVRWEGYIQPLTSGAYSFLVSADDGYRLYIDIAGSTLTLADRWNCNWTQNTTTAAVTLTAGQLYKVRMDFFENTGNQFAQLLWKTPNNPGNWTAIPNAQVYSPDNLSSANNTVVTTTQWCTKLDSVNVRDNALTDTLSLVQGRKMLLSAWVKEGGVDCKCSTYVKNNITISYTGNNQTLVLQPSGSIIEGWQRYEAVFTVPANATAIDVALNNTNTNGTAVYFDDVRLHPFNANMKGFVYHSSNLRLMSDLDENNYASFYEYDDDGTLTRMKKETERGIKTIKETRSAMQKKVND